MNSAEIRYGRAFAGSAMVEGWFDNHCYIRIYEGRIQSVSMLPMDFERAKIVSQLYQDVISEYERLIEEENKKYAYLNGEIL